MGNSWFRFRQFMVHQQNAAMKVTTDACLFGALQPRLPGLGNEKKVLDIGAGTGLLSLMMAQQNPEAEITAIEIDANAVQDAVKNFGASPFPRRPELLHMDFLDFNPGYSFHHIISNPPFHESQLASPDAGRNLAHHAGGLTLAQLLTKSRTLLAPEGTLSVLLPFYREKEALAEAGLIGLGCQKLVRVRQSPKHGFFRSVIFMARNVTGTEEEEITIRDSEQRYTQEFTRLLSPFYLNL